MKIPNFSKGIAKRLSKLMESFNSTFSKTEEPPAKQEIKTPQVNTGDPYRDAVLEKWLDPSYKLPKIAVKESSKDPKKRDADISSTTADMSDDDSKVKSASSNDSRQSHSSKRSTQSTTSNSSQRSASTLDGHREMTRMPIYNSETRKSEIPASILGDGEYVVGKMENVPDIIAAPTKLVVGAGARVLNGEEPGIVPIITDTAKSAGDVLLGVVTGIYGLLPSAYQMQDLGNRMGVTAGQAAELTTNGLGTLADKTLSGAKEAGNLIVKVPGQVGEIASNAALVAEVEAIDLGMRGLALATGMRGKVTSNPNATYVERQKFQHQGPSYIAPQGGGVGGRY